MDMMTAFPQLALLGGYVEWWQILCLLILIALISFLIWYRKKQM
jgi:hypothetical protein